MARKDVTCCVLLAFFAVAGQFLEVQAFTQTVTSGDSGDQCPPGPQCLAGEAQCIDDKCKCQAPTSKGIGNFLCHRPNEVFCAVFSDPEVRGYNGGYAHAPLSCKFHLTHLLLPICNTADPANVITTIADGTCDVKVRAWGARRKGKTFIKGLDIRFIVTYLGTDYYQTTRIWSTAANGTYTFYESTNNAAFGGPTSGPSSNLTIPGLGSIYTTYNQNGDNFARVVAEMCGVEIGLRGVDSVVSPRNVTAGVYIKVNQDCEPTYLTPGTTLCSPPSGKGASLADHAATLSAQTGRPVSLDIAAMHRVLTGTEPQDFPGVAPGLQQLMDTAMDCPDDRIVDAIEKNVFIMNDVKFLRCFDDTDNLQTAIELFDMGLFSVCDNNDFVCRRVQEKVDNSTCLLRTEEGTLMAEDCGAA